MLGRITVSLLEKYLTLLPIPRQGRIGDACIVPSALIPTALQVVFAAIDSNVLAGTPLKVMAVGALDLFVAFVAVCAVADDLWSSVFTHASSLQ